MHPMGEQGNVQSHQTLSCDHVCFRAEGPDPQGEVGGGQGRQSPAEGEEPQRAAGGRDEPLQGAGHVRRGAHARRGNC